MSRGDDSGEEVANAASEHASSVAGSGSDTASSAAEQIKVPKPVSMETTLTPEETSKSYELNKLIGGPAPEPKPEPVKIPEAGDFTPEEEKAFDKGFNIDRLNAIQRAKEIQDQSIFQPQLDAFGNKINSYLDRTKEGISNIGETALNDIKQTINEGPIGKTWTGVKDATQELADKFDAYTKEQEEAAQRAAEEARKAEEAKRAAEELAQAKEAARAADRAEVQSAEQSLRDQGIIQGIVDRRDFEAVRELVKAGDPEATKLWAEWQNNLDLPKDMSGEIRGFAGRYK
jgi:hypothetical protein